MIFRKVAKKPEWWIRGKLKEKEEYEEGMGEYLKKGGKKPRWLRGKNKEKERYEEGLGEYLKKGR